MSIADRDPGPMARLAAVRADAGAPGEVFRRLTERESLKDLAVAWKVPKGRFVEWFTTEHADLYDAALKVVAADLALEALDIADEQAEVVKESGGTYDPDVSRDKLRVDTRLKLASKLDRARYGETVRVEKSVTLGVDAGLLGTVADLLRLGVPRAPRVLEHEIQSLPEQVPGETLAGAEPPSVATPARAAAGPI